MEVLEKDLENLANRILTKKALLAAHFNAASYLSSTTKKLMAFNFAVSKNGY